MMYHCEKCGPDSNGAAVHMLTHHTLPPMKVDAAIALVAKQNPLVQNIKISEVRSGIRTLRAPQPGEVDKSDIELYIELPHNPGWFLLASNLGWTILRLDATGTQLVRNNLGSPLGNLQAALELNLMLV